MSAKFVTPLEVDTTPEMFDKNLSDGHAEVVTDVATSGLPLDDRNGPHTAVSQVIDHLEGLIFDEVEVGADLPSEVDLARSLQVSRLTVREAIRTLQARGLVQTSPGRRPRVAAPSGFAIGDFFQSTVRRDPRALLDLLDIRQALEVHTASLVASQATRNDVAALERALTSMRANAERPELFHNADIDFHEALAAASGNRLMAMLLQELAEPLRASMLRSYAGHMARGIPVSVAIDQHEEILAGIQAGDPRKAAAAMRRHLKQTKKDLLAGLAEAVPDHSAQG